MRARIPSLLALCCSACSAEPAPFALPADAFRGSLALIVGADAFALDLVSPLDVRAHLVDDDAPTWAIAYDDSLAAHQLAVDAEHRLIRSTGEPSRPLPRGARAYARTDGTWSAVDDPESLRNTLRVPAFDADTCATAGGCFALDAPEVCLLPCPEPTEPETPIAPAAPVPPALPALLTCPSGSTARPITTPPELSTLTDCALDAVFACIHPQVLAWGRTTCASLGTCSRTPWPLRPPAGSIFVAPGGTGDGSSTARPLGTIDDALALRRPTATVVLSADRHAAPRAAVDAPLLGVCPDRTSVVGRLRMTSTSSLADLRVEGSVVVEPGSTGVSFRRVLVDSPGPVAIDVLPGAQVGASVLHVAGPGTAIRAERATLSLVQWGAQAELGLDLTSTGGLLRQGRLRADVGARVSGPTPLRLEDLVFHAPVMIEARSGAVVRARRWVGSGSLSVRDATTDVELLDAVIGTSTTSAGELSLQRVRIAREAGAIDVREGGRLELRGLLWSRTDAAPPSSDRVLRATAAGLDAQGVVIEAGRVEALASSTATVTDVVLVGASGPAFAVVYSEAPGSLVMSRARIAVASGPPPIDAVAAFAALRATDLDLGPAFTGIHVDQGGQPARVQRAYLHDLRGAALDLDSPATIEDVRCERTRLDGPGTGGAIELGQGGRLARASVRLGLYQAAVRVQPNNSAPDIAYARLEDLDLDLGVVAGVRVVRTASLSGARWRMRGDSAYGLSVFTAGTVALRDIDITLGEGASGSGDIVGAAELTVARFALSGAALGVQAADARGDGDLVLSDGVLEASGGPVLTLGAGVVPWTVLDRVRVRGPVPRFVGRR